jgi:hypothetical protein
VGLGHSPSIVINGLVLALDAANPKSYPGSGTNWSDLIGSGNNGTLTNGSYYRSTSGGSIVFDGSDDNVSIGTNGFSFGSSPGTLSAWAATRDRTSTRTIVSYGSSVTNQARFLGVGASNFYFSGYGSSISASGISTDTWFNMVGVYDGTNASMYVNGALVAGPTDRSSWNTIASNAGIGKNVSNTEYWQGDVAQVSVYNRALSAAEIQQNYNALKGRYANYVPTIIPYWIATLGGTAQDEGNGIAVDGSGNVYITGFTSSGSGGALIAKYNSSGAIQWQRTLGGTSTEYGFGIAVDGSGNVYITGFTDLAGNRSVLIAKYDTSGTIQWQRTLDGAGTDQGFGIAVDGSGNVYVTGHTYSSGAGSNDFLIAKYDTSGTIQWQRTLGGANTDYGYGIAVDGSGNVYITGITASSGAGGFDVLIAKYDTSGTIQWQRTLGGAGNDIGNDIVVDGSGNLYITGYTASSGAGGQDVLIAKLPADGAFTGTYGAYTYATSSLTAATSSLTAATSSLTAATPTLTAATSSITAATSALTSSIIVIP